MSRSARLLRVLLGLLIGAGGIALCVHTATERKPGALFAAGFAILVVGALTLAAGLEKDEGSFDPGEGIDGDWAYEEQAWSLSEALGLALWTMRKGWRRLVPLGLLAVAVMLIGASGIGVAARLLAPELIEHIQATVGRGPDATLRAALDPSAPGFAPVLAVLVPMVLLVYVVLAAVNALVAKSALATLRKRVVSNDDTAGALRCTARLFAFHLLLPFLVLLSLPVLAFPAMPFTLAPYFIVDQNMGLGQALLHAWRAGRSSMGRIWAFHIVMGLVNIVGSLTIVGTAVTQGIQVSGLAYVYARVTGRVGLPPFQPDMRSRFTRRTLKTLLLMTTACFAAFVTRIDVLATRRGAPFSVSDMSLRTSAIVAGVAAVVLMLALLLPYLLDLLEGDSVTSFVAARHVRSQSGFLTAISVLSICGVAISTCALATVISVMGGFSQDLKRKILGSSAHVVIDTTPGTPFGDYADIAGALRKVPGVVGAAPVVTGEVMASSASNLAGVVVAGVDPASIGDVVELSKNLEVGGLEFLEAPARLVRLPPDQLIGYGPGGERYYKGADLPSLPDDLDPAVRAALFDKPEYPGLIVGRELAKTLHVYLGSEVTLVSPLGDLGPMGVMPRTKKFRVAGIFYSGMYEYDAMKVYVMLDVAQQYFQAGERVTSIDLKLTDADHVDDVTPKVAAVVAGKDLRVRDWRDINRSLFNALKLERVATFIILSIAIVVASFCVACTLLLMVTEKGKEIAVLKSLGATDGTVLRTFIIEGVIISAIGTGFGVITGFALCSGISTFGLLLDPEVYYIDRLPISVNGWDFLAVAAASLPICTLSTLYPAYSASRLRPVEGLRFD